MPNTYTQIYIHYVFATEIRLRLLTEETQKELYTYCAGITKELNCFLQCIGGMEDHIHILVGLHPTLSVSEYAQKIKASSSRFINEKGWALGKFQWQKGFGAFSVSQSGLERVRNYIKNQKEHHQGQSFSSEYETLLTKYRINYDKQYVFHDPEDLNLSGYIVPMGLGLLVDRGFYLKQRPYRTLAERITSSAI